jgi:hypothetical protein
MVHQTNCRIIPQLWPDERAIYQFSHRLSHQAMDLFSVSSASTRGILGIYHQRRRLVDSSWQEATAVAAVLPRAKCSSNCCYRHHWIHIILFPFAAIIHALILWGRWRVAVSSDDSSHVEKLDSSKTNNYNSYDDNIEWQFRSFHGSGRKESIMVSWGYF